MVILTFYEKVVEFRSLGTLSVLPVFKRNSSFFCFDSYLSITQSPRLRAEGAQWGIPETSRQ